MSKPEIIVILTPKGDIIFSGNEAQDLAGWARAAEIWHSQPDQGLAFRFLANPSPASVELRKSGEGEFSALLPAAGFLAKVGYELPAEDHVMFVTAYDEARKVLSTRREK